MANIIISPNMSLVIPTVGTDPGPDWANNINASLSIIDGHNHTSGQGVAITPNAININTDLTFGSNNATLLRSVRFSPQSSSIGGATDIGCLYEAGVDLYYNDGNGNQIRITQSGTVAGSAGTITGLPSGTASASYQSGPKTFVFQSSTNTSANIDGASLILRNLTASSNGVTLSPPSTIASNFTITLPTPPVSRSFVTMDSSGIFDTTAPYPLQASGIASGVLPQLQSQNFTSSGNWTAPANVSNIVVYGCGGGGGGAPGGGAGGPGGGGGAGAMYAAFPAAVTPGSTYTVSIASSVGAATDGANSSFGGIVFLGGARGLSSAGAGLGGLGGIGGAGYSAGGNGGSASSVGVGLVGANSTTQRGGVGGAVSGSTGGGGGGGAGFGSAGGAGGSAPTGTGGTGTGIGAGGGGGGGTGGGGGGGPGNIVVTWVSP